MSVLVNIVFHDSTVIIKTDTRFGVVYSNEKAQP